MKIGILIDRLNIGGVEKIAIEEVRALRKIGEDARLVVLREKAVVNNAFPDLLKDVPIEYLDKRLPKPLRFSFGFPYFHFLSMFHITYPFFLPFVVKQNEYDYIIAHGTYTSLSAIALKKIRKIDFSSFIWDPATYIIDRVYSQNHSPVIIKPLRLIATCLDKYLINNMDNILVGGAAHNAFFSKINPKKSIRIIYPSVHPIKKTLSKEDYVLMVTAWKKGKNPEYVLEIAKKMPGVVIVMAGKWIDQTHKQEFEKNVKNQNLDKQIKITGEISEKKLSKLYAKAKLILQTNDDRGFGMPAMEAAGNGSTFIIPEGQGVCELFDNNVDGYYTKEKDTDAIVSLIQLLMEDTRLCSSMGKSALNKVKASYSWQKHAEKLQQIIRGSTISSQKSIHVLFTGLVSPKMLSGGDQLILDIAPRLPEDMRVVIITPSFAKNHWKNVNRKNIEYRFLKPNIFDQKEGAIATFLSYVIRSWQVNKILRHEKIQTIYSCSDIAYADIWPAYRAAANNPKIKWLSRIYHVLLPPNERQGSYLVNFIAFRLQRLSFWMMKRGSSKIMALNKKLYDEVYNLGFPKNKLAILEAGIDFKAISSFRPSKKHPYDIVVLGRIAPVKGVFDAVKIWEIVHSTYPELQLAWIGGGPENYKSAVHEQLVEKALTDSFHMLGFLDKKEVYNILKSAKIFLCPDHENGWGLAVCEAMALGLPVVSYNLDIFGGVYKKGFVSAPLFDTESFANKIIELIDDAKKRTKIAMDARDQASKFDHKRVVNDLVKLLD